MSDNNHYMYNQTFGEKSVANNSGAVNFNEGGTHTKNVQGPDFSSGNFHAPINYKQGSDFSNAHFGNNIGRDKIGGDNIGGNKNLGGTNFSGQFDQSPIAVSGQGPVNQNTTSSTTGPNVGKPLKEGEQGKINKEKLPEYERLINNKLLSVSFLLKGTKIQDYVCKIVTKYDLATGFLIGPHILMSNHHIFPDSNNARGAKAIFGYNDQHSFSSLKEVAIKEFIYADPELDFAVVSLCDSMPGYISLPHGPLEYATGQHANIIGHPNGNAKMVSLRSNEVTEVFTNAIEYTSDTEPGSSGSPVFDNDWELIAIHSGAGKKDDKGNWISNIGFRIDKIAAHITQHEELKKLVFG